jgi:DUF4097 and DUF4098 domain-containing protein YvlB
MKYYVLGKIIYASLVLASFLLLASPSPARCIALRDDEHGNQAKTFTVSKGGTLEVEVTAGNLRIQPTDKNEVSVRYQHADEEDDEGRGVRISQKGNVVRVTTDPRWEEYNDNDIDFDITVPSQFNFSLETSAGDITIKGNVTGTVDCRTSGGNITTMAVTGNTDLTTSGGDIITDDIKGDLSVRTSGGNIRTGSVTGVTDVHTSGGDIEIERADKKLTAHTDGGNVHIGNIGGDALVGTSGGDITLEHVNGSASLKTAGGNIDLRSAVGAVTLKTAGGDVRADSVAGSIDAKTSAGNIDILLLPSGTGKSRLSTSVGDIRLYIPEKSKASISARNRMKYSYWGNDDDEEIVSDYPDSSYDNDSRNREVRATYILNGGGQDIDVEASMGNIYILKPDSHKATGHKQKSHQRHKSY